MQIANDISAYVKLKVPTCFENVIKNLIRPIGFIKLSRAGVDLYIYFFSL